MQRYGLIFQWDSSEKDPLLIIEWVFLPYKSPKPVFTIMKVIAQVIMRTRTRLLTVAS